MSPGRISDSVVVPLAKPSAALSWQERDAEALDTRADNIEQACIALERLDGMFAERDELSSTVVNATRLLRLEEDNLRTKAKRLRGEA